MNAISRRSFLKLAGVTAVAAAGASMLTGCSIVEEVTIIPVLNGEVLSNTETVPMPGFVSDFGWAFDLAMPIAKKQYADIPGFEQVQFERDTEYPNNCKVITDPDTGKKVMYIAIKCNVIEGMVYVVDTATGSTVHAYGGIELPDTLTEIPEEYAQQYLDNEAVNYPEYTITLAVRPDNRQIVKSADGKSFTATVYIDIVKKA